MYKKKITLEVIDRDNTIERLLTYIMKLSNMGHGFDVDVDIDDKEYHKHFYVDGDGSDRIVSFKVEED